MFKLKYTISLAIFFIFLIFTSFIKNQTRVIEKQISNMNKIIYHKEIDLNESQLDFDYLTSPAEIEKKIDLIGFKNYKEIENINIFLNISDFIKFNNKISNSEKLNEKKIKKR
tara:strand:+ start:506 stop:844 length:339 start_codon:yes stop_codon:yes gene_type:complete